MKSIQNVLIIGCLSIAGMLIFQLITQTPEHFEELLVNVTSAVLFLFMAGIISGKIPDGAIPIPDEKEKEAEKAPVYKPGA